MESEVAQSTKYGKTVSLILVIILTFFAGRFSDGNGHSDHFTTGVVECAPCTSYIETAVRDVSAKPMSDIVVAVRSLAKEQQNIIKFIKDQHQENDAE